MYYAGDVFKIRVTSENIDKFTIVDERTERVDYINDRKALEKKLVAFEKGEIDELTKIYPERYDLTVLTYNQYLDPWRIVDGCHRIEAMRKTLLPEKLIDGFDFWMIPTNNWGPESAEEVLRLRDMVDKELKEKGLPKWVNKFYFTMIDNKLTAWKNINIIDTGDIKQPLQFGVDWKLNDGWDFAKDKELKDLPKWRDLIK